MINYTIKELIGSGSYSKVYRVQHNNNSYAMKKTVLSNITNKDILIRTHVQVCLNMCTGTTHVLKNGGKYFIFEN